MSEKSMKTWTIEVLPDGSGRTKNYKVRATTLDDAIQLAFALDGGWGKDRDATEMLQLAKSYAAEKCPT